MSDPSEAGEEEEARAVPGSHLGMVAVTSIAQLPVLGRANIRCDLSKGRRGAAILRGMGGSDCWHWGD